MDKVYTYAGYLAGVFLVTVLLCTLASIISRMAGTTFNFNGVGEYAGYAMAASSFLALASTLRHGEHIIRVTLILNRLVGRPQFYLEVFCHLIGLLFAALLCWFSLRLVYLSFQYHDISPGLDATPLWIPQLGMAAGSALFFIAMVDQSIGLLKTKKLPVQKNEAGDIHFME